VKRDSVLSEMLKGKELDKELVGQTLPSRGREWTKKRPES